MSKEEKSLAIEDLESKAETELVQLRNEAYQSGLDLDTVNSIFADVYSDGWLEPLSESDLW